MKFMCDSGHLHNTQEAATNCYICKKKAQRGSKRAKRQQESKKQGRCKELLAASLMDD